MQTKPMHDMVKVTRFMKLNSVRHEDTLADVMHLYYLAPERAIVFERRALRDEIAPKNHCLLPA